MRSKYCSATSSQLSFGHSNRLSPKILICKFLNKLKNKFIVFSGFLVFCFVKNKEYLITKE